jgi:hypothetical protein
MHKNKFKLSIHKNNIHSNNKNTISQEQIIDYQQDKSSSESNKIEKEDTNTSNYFDS